MVSLLLGLGESLAEMAETFPSPKGLSAREKALRARVLEYLSQHPQAMDTLDGIAEWWLRGEGESIDRIELGNVLSFLNAEGIVKELYSGSDTRFALRESRKTPPAKMGG